MEGRGRVYKCQKLDTGRVPCMYKNITHLCSSMIYNALAIVACKMWVLKAYLASFTYIGMVLSPSWYNELRFTVLLRLTVKEVHIAFWSNSWASPGQCVILIQLINLRFGCFAATSTHMHNLTCLISSVTNDWATAAISLELGVYQGACCDLWCSDQPSWHLDTRPDVGFPFLNSCHHVNLLKYVDGTSW